MELRKLATALDNAKDDLKKGITKGLEKEILHQSFKEFTQLHYIFTGKELSVIEFSKYCKHLDEQDSLIKTTAISL